MLTEAYGVSSWRTWPW